MMFLVRMQLRLFITTITWTCLTAYVIRPYQKCSIDQIISNAMTSPNGYDFMYDEPHGIIRVDMDMIYSIGDWTRITSFNCSRHGGIHKRQAIKNGVSGTYWPGGIVDYVIDPFDFNYGEVKMIRAAMNEWMRYTCIQFRPAGRNTQNKIRFANSQGCSSHVGMVGGTQNVNLSPGCRHKGVVLHEVGHALGFQHEQTRPDRDTHVKIHYENVPNHLWYNFQKYSWAVIANLGIPYDYLSIMHYGKDAFSSNGKDTIETLDFRYQDVIGRRQTLSFRDIKAANIMYNCRSASSSCQRHDEDCPGEGFVGKDCRCWCPPKNPVSRKSIEICKPGSGSSETNVHPNPVRKDPHTAKTGSHAGKGNRGGCVDSNDNCNVWVSEGYCTQQPAYMEYYCKRACGLCDTVTSTCRDESKSCSYWRQQGYCQESSSFNFFMSTSCRKTCGVCPTDPGPEDRTILPCERNCRDEHPLCAIWAARGECSATEDYMRLRCRKACNFCCPSGADKTKGADRYIGKASSWIH